MPQLSQISPHCGHVFAQHPFDLPAQPHFCAQFTLAALGDLALQLQLVALAQRDLRPRCGGLGVVDARAALAGDDEGSDEKGPERGDDGKP